jgi:hypothetical protein
MDNITIKTKILKDYKLKVPLSQNKKWKVAHILYPKL